MQPPISYSDSGRFRAGTIDSLEAKPITIAELLHIAFMSSDKASYMTGQCINVDGGILIHSPPMKFD